MKKLLILLIFLLLSTFVSADINCYTYLYDSNKSIPIEPSQGIVFNQDGNKLYTIDSFASSTPDTGYDFNLTSSYDISNITKTSKFYTFSAGTWEAGGVLLNSNGTKMYVAEQYNRIIQEYTFGVPYDINTLSYTTYYDINAGATEYPYAMTYNNNGTKLYVLFGNGGKIRQYSLSTPYTLNGLVYDNIYLQLNLAGGGAYSGVAVDINKNKLYASRYGGNIIAFNLINNSDINTAIELGTALTPSFSLTKWTTDKNFSKFFLWDSTGDLIYTYTKSTMDCTVPTTTLSYTRTGNDYNIKLTCADNNTGCKTINYKFDSNSWVKAFSYTLDSNDINALEVQSTQAAYRITSVWTPTKVSGSDTYKYYVKTISNRMRETSSATEHVKYQLVFMDGTDENTSENTQTGSSLTQKNYTVTTQNKAVNYVRTWQDCVSGTTSCYYSDTNIKYTKSADTNLIDSNYIYIGFSGTGDHNIWYYSTDNADNNAFPGDQNVIPFKPITTLNTTASLTSWNNSSKDFNFTCWDYNGSGCNLTQYRIDNGSWNIFNDDINKQSIPDENSIYSGGVLTNGLLNSLNISGTNKKIIYIDVNSKYTAVGAGAGAIAIKYYYTDGTTSLSEGISVAKDIYTKYTFSTMGSVGKDINRIELLASLAAATVYEKDWNVYIVDKISLTTDGNHQIDYNSTDSLGNTELTKTSYIAIDSVSPTTTLTQVNGTTGWNTIDINFTLSCSDTNSGCALTQYRVDDDSWVTYSSTVTLSTDGNHKIDYNSTDNAGNAEAIKTYYIAIDKINRYWVGGTGTWSDTNTIPWAYSSGGAGGASVPTSSNNVFFDSGSGSGTVTIYGVKYVNDLNLSGASINFSTGGVAAASGCYANGWNEYIFNQYASIGAYGNVDYGSKNINVRLLSNSGVKTITTNGTSLTGLFIDGNGSFKFMDNINISGNLYIGGQDTNLDPNDKNVKLTSNNAKLYINPVNKNIRFYNLNYNPTLNITSSVGRLDINGDFNIANIFSLRGTGAGEGKEIFVTSSFYNQSQTNLRSTIVSHINDFNTVNFESIIAGGDANWDLRGIPGEAGDYGNNTGITFLPSMDLYYVGGAADGNWTDSTKWMTSSGGATPGRVPLAQDRVFIDGSSFSGARTLNADSSFLSSINFSGSSDVNFVMKKGYTYAKNSLDWSAANIFKADHISDRYLYLYSSANSFINTNNKDTNVSIYLLSDYNYSLQSNISTPSIYVVRGGLDLNSKDVNFGTISVSPSAKYFNMFNSDLLLKGADTYFTPNVFSGALYLSDKANLNTTNSIITATTNYYSYIGCSDSNININTVINKATGIYGLQFYGNITINYLSADINTTTAFTSGDVFTINSITADGNSDLNVYLRSSLYPYSQVTPQATLLWGGTGTAVVNYASIRDLNVGPAHTWYAVNSYDVNDNNGWIFGLPYRYWVGGAGDWNDTSHWAYTSNGPGGAPIPTQYDDVFFDTNSGLIDNDIINNSDTIYFRNFNSLTGKKYIIGDSDLTSIIIYGSIILEPNLSIYPNIEFRGIGNKFIDQNNGYFISYFDFYDGNYYLYDDLNIGGDIGVNSGAKFDTNNFDIYSLQYLDISDNSILKLNSSSLFLNAFYIYNNVDFNSGTSEINLVKGNNVSPIAFYADPGYIFYNLNLFSAGNGIVDIGAASTTGHTSYTFNKISFTGNNFDINTIKFEPDVNITVNDFNIKGNSVHFIDINGNATAPVRFIKNSGIVTVDYLRIKDSNATGGATWYAGTNSIDFGGNSGWIFGPAPGGNRIDFNVYDGDLLTHLNNITMDCNDNTYDSSGNNSPFYNLMAQNKNYLCTFSRTGYDSNTNINIVTDMNKTITVLLYDTTPPVTTISGNSLDWTNTNQTITLSCVDGGSGCLVIQYNINDTNWKNYNISLDNNYSQTTGSLGFYAPSMFYGVSIIPTENYLNYITLKMSRDNTKQFDINVIITDMNMNDPYAYADAVPGNILKTFILPYTSIQVGAPSTLYDINLQLDFNVTAYKPYSILLSPTGGTSASYYYLAIKTTPGVLGNSYSCGEPFDFDNCSRDNRNIYYQLYSSSGNIVFNTDGNYKFDYKSIDSAGNIETAHTAYIGIDKTAPTTGNIFNALQWIAAPFYVIFTGVQDLVSGIFGIFVSTNNGASYTDANVIDTNVYVYINKDGNTTINLWVRDNAGNDKNLITYAGLDNNGIQIKGGFDGNGLPWKNYDFNVVALDVNFGPSGKFLAKYSFDGGAFQDLLISDNNYYFTDTQDGNHTVIFWFRSISGVDTNITLYSLSDKSGPTNLADANFGLPWHTEDFNVRVDMNFWPSGKSLAKYSIDGTNYYDFNTPNDVNFYLWIASDGNKTVRGWFRDLAGNDTNFIGYALLDKTPPTVLSITPSTLVVTTPGIDAFWIDVNFSEDMDTAISPGIVFQPTVFPTLSCGTTWLDINTYRVFCNVDTAEAYIMDINFRVTGGKDIAGNTMAATWAYSLFDINTDATAPTIVVSGNSLNWTTTNQTVTITATDSVSGVALTQYSIDDGAWNTYTVPFTISTDLNHTIDYNSKDNAGNTTGVRRTYAAIDKTKPITTDNTDTSWHGNDFTVTLSPTDNLSGIATTYYCVDDANVCTPTTLYTGAYVVTCPTDGVCNRYTRYYSVDVAGNIEDTKGSKMIKIDHMRPSVGLTTLTGYTISGTYINNNGNVIGGAASDTNGSGINTATCEYTVNGGSTWAAGTWNTDHCEKTTAGAIVNGQTYTFNTRVYDSALTTPNLGTGSSTIAYTGDTVGPTVSISGNSLNWTTTNQTVTITATDSASGVALTQYSLNSGAWTTYSGPFLVTNDANNTIDFNSTDNLGNASAIVRSYAAIDKIDPTVGATSISGFDTNNVGGTNYFKGTGTVVGGTATDTPSGIDTSSCQYTIDNGGNWLSASWSVDHCRKTSWSGTNGLTYAFNTRVSDLAGNQKAGTVTSNYTYDTNGPQSTLSYTQPVAGVPTINVTINCADANSGCQRISYRFDGNAGYTHVFNPTSATFSISGVGPHQIYYYTRDNLGNDETVKDINVYIAGRLRVNVRDENTRAWLTGVTFKVNGNPALYTIDGNSDINLAGLTLGNPTELIFSKSGYGTRTYWLDMNAYSNYDVNMLLIQATKQLVWQFKFYYNDGNTVATNAWVELYRPDMNNYSIGRFYTNGTGTATFSVNKYDQNYTEKIIAPTGDINYAYPVALMVFKPKDESTTLTIDGNWNLIGPTPNTIFTNITGDQNVLILPNLYYPFSMIVVDSNALDPVAGSIYFPRTYVETYLGNPLSDELQPYLVSIVNGELIKFIVQNELGIAVPNITIHISKLISGSKTMVASGASDSSGEFSVPLIVANEYYFDLYANGQLLLPKEETRIQINESRYYFTISISYDVNNYSTSPVYLAWNPITEYLYTQTQLYQTIASDDVAYAKVNIVQYLNNDNNVKTVIYTNPTWFDCTKSCVLNENLALLVNPDKNRPIYVDINLYRDNNTLFYQASKRYKLQVTGTTDILQLMFNARRSFGCRITDNSGAAINPLDYNYPCASTTIISLLLAIFAIGGLVFTIKIINPYAMGMIGGIVLIFFTLSGWFYWPLLFIFGLLLIAGLYGRRGAE